jgi:transcriptional regulator with XRE-family HTH domain
MESILLKVRKEIKGNLTQSKVLACKNIEGNGMNGAKSDYNVMMGRRLRYLREYRNVTQEELGKYLGYTSSGTVSRIEAGEIWMSKERVVRAAEKLGVHPYILQTADEIPQEKLILISEIIKVVLDPTKTQTSEAIAAIVTSAKSKI